MHKAIIVFVHVISHEALVDIYNLFFVPKLHTFPFAITRLHINISAKMQVTHFWFIIRFFPSNSFVIPVHYFSVQKNFIFL